jgi:hypothetical protein
LQKNSNPGVYLVPCKCGLKYIGETGSLIRTRMKQHQYSIFREKWTDSGLAEHCKACKSNIDWEGVKSLKSESDFYKRAIRESLEIQYFDTLNSGMNKDAGRYVKTNQWQGVFAHMKRNQTSLNKRKIEKPI